MGEWAPNYEAQGFEDKVSAAVVHRKRMFLFGEICPTWRCWSRRLNQRGPLVDKGPGARGAARFGVIASTTKQGYYLGLCAKYAARALLHDVLGSRGSNEFELDANAALLGCVHLRPVRRSPVRRSKVKKPRRDPRRRLRAQAHDSHPTKRRLGQSALAHAS